VDHSQVGDEGTLRLAVRAFVCGYNQTCSFLATKSLHDWIILITIKHLRGIFRGQRTNIVLSLQVRLGGRGFGEFKLSWRETGSPNHHDDTVDSDQ
jgi:hypothetical protein